MGRKRDANATLEAAAKTGARFGYVRAARGTVHLGEPRAPTDDH